MEWDYLAPMIVLTTLILTTGGVLLLRPLAKRLGDLLEIMAKERRGGLPGAEVGKLSELLETMNARLSLVEERQDFTEALLTRGRSPEQADPSSPEREP